MHNFNLTRIIILSIVLTHVRCLPRNMFAIWEVSLFLADWEITFFVVISIPTRWTLACEHLIKFGKYPLKIFLTMLFLID